MTASAENNVSHNYWLCTQTRGDCIEFEWTFEKFHQMPQKNGESIYSPVFPNNSQEQWKLRIYPQGYKTEDDGWISIYLWPASDKMFGIKVQFEISVFRLRKTLKTQKLTYKFEKAGGFGISDLIERSKLSLENDPTDTITIRCKIEVLGTYITSSFKNKSSDTVILFERRENRLTEDFQSFYENPTSTDFTVIAGDKRFQTHKLILASRSPVFSAMFQHKEVEENVRNELKIENIEPAVVGGLLEFIYTDNVSKIGEFAHGLLAAAEQYGIKGLKNLCEETLYKTLSEDNAAELLAFADLHNAHQLKKYIMQFILEHSKNIVESKAFASVEMPLDLAKEIIRAVIRQASENSQI